MYTLHKLFQKSVSKLQKVLGGIFYSVQELKLNVGKPLPEFVPIEGYVMNHKTGMHSDVITNFEILIISEFGFFLSLISYVKSSQYCIRLDSFILKSDCKT